MGAHVDISKCTGCPGALDPFCSRICPGNLIFKDSNGKVSMRSVSECWDCAACVKACPNQAISLSLSFVIGGKGSELKVRSRAGSVEWEIIRADGTREIIVS